MDDLERQLIEKAKQGDSAAGPFLVSYFGERLLGYARAHAPDLSDADREHAVELAIEAGVRAIAKFDPSQGSLVGWFRTQVRYKVLAIRRSNPEFVNAEGPLPERPEGGLTASQTQALRAAIAELSHEDQLILALRSAEQLEHGEIATRLGISADAVRQRHSRAIRRLRTAIESLPEFSYLGGENNEQ